MTWTVCNVHVGAFNTKQTFTSSGTFTAPVSGTYRITLQGAGGGGGGYGYCSNSQNYSGGGGSSGACISVYEKLVAGTTYSFTIGAGGTAGTNGVAGPTDPNRSVGTDGGNGGNSVITIGTDTIIATGGKGAKGSGASGTGGAAVYATINGNNVIDSVSKAGFSGSLGTSAPFVQDNGNGGSGGGYQLTTLYQPTAGGDGYITFEYCNV